MRALPFAALPVLFAAAAFAAAPPPPRPAAPVERAAVPAPRPTVVPKAVLPTGGGLCGDPRISGKPARDPGGRGACGIANPVRLSAVAGVALRPAPLVDCALARKLADWVQGPVRQAARAEGMILTAMRTMAGFACRTRNHRPGARLSEHAFGRAVDIGAFRFEGGREIVVLNHWRGEGGRFLKSVWRGACGPFKTVLGPDFDRLHRNHFHLDVARRRSTYCR